MSYNGQEDLGLKLRKATSTTTDPAGLDLVHKTLCSTTTGDVIETRTPASDAEVVYPPVYQATFGSSGSGSGQFSHPEGIGLDTGGNVWVADHGNNRIEKFTASGTVIAPYGSAGSGDGQFSSPWGVAVNQSTGNVYVADSGNRRLEELNSAGEFVEAIGWGVSDGKAELEVCKAACKAGISGSGNGELDEPVGLTVDSTGNVWVADEGDDRVQEFSATGTYVRQFGSKGTGNGQMIEPTGVAISEGEIYVVDYGNDRVEESTPSGGYLAQFGSKGTGRGQFSYPVGITANATSGDLYISDAGNSRIEEWTPAGKYLTEFGAYGSGNGQLNTPTGLAVNATGQLYISDLYNERISQWRPQGAGGARMLYSSQFGTAGSGNGQFSNPSSDAIDGHGNLWVTDFNNNRVQEFSSTGKFIAAYGSHGSGHGQFANPTGIAVNQSTGNVYVGDCGNDRVEELNSSGVQTNASGEYTLPQLMAGQDIVEFYDQFGARLVRQYYDDKSSRAEAMPLPVTPGATITGIDASMHAIGEESIKPPAAPETPISAKLVVETPLLPKTPIAAIMGVRLVVSGGSAPVRVACSQAACQGSIELVVQAGARPGKGRRHQDKSALARDRRDKEMIVLATGSFSLAEGSDGAVLLRLTSTGRQKLAHARRHPIAAKLIMSVKGGGTATKSVLAS